jgi:hypothetical protein
MNKYFFIVINLIITFKNVSTQSNSFKNQFKKSNISKKNNNNQSPITSTKTSVIINCEADEFLDEEQIFGRITFSPTVRKSKRILKDTKVKRQKSKYYQQVLVLLVRRQNRL